MKSVKRLLTGYFCALAIACLDDKIKASVEDGRIDNSVIKSGKCLIKIEKHHNSGFAGNRLSGRQELVASVSAASAAVQACISGYDWLCRDLSLSSVANVLLLAGGLSNTKDRVSRRYVVDYLRIKDRIYNLSDFCIFAGAALGVINVLAGKRESRGRHEC